MSEQDDFHAGLRAGQTGSVFGPQSEAGRAGFNAGVGLARQQPGAGSPEWLIAPVVLSPFVAIFYPVATAAALAVGLTVERVVNAIGLGGNSLVRWAFVIGAIVAVFWPLCRRDQVWGLNRTYYLIRHGVRLLIIALLLNGAAQNGAASANNLPIMPAMTAMFKTPIQWLPVLLGVGAMQLFFMRAYQWRIYWNIRLKMWHLRPKGFEPFYFTWRKAKPDAVTTQAPIEMPRQRFTE